MTYAHSHGSKDKLNINVLGNTQCASAVGIVNISTCTMLVPIELLSLSPLSILLHTPHSTAYSYSYVRNTSTPSPSPLVVVLAYASFS